MFPTTPHGDREFSHFCRRVAARHQDRLRRMTWFPLPRQANCKSARRSGDPGVARRGRLKWVVSVWSWGLIRPSRWQQSAESPYR
jgi:hypothetical protein